MNTRLLIALFVLISVVGFIAVYSLQPELVELEGQQTEISTHQNVHTNTAGYQVSEHTFIATLGECRIEWQLVEADGVGQRYLELSRQCQLPFAEQVAMHRELLTRINERSPLAQIQLIKWHGLCSDGSEYWCRDLAAATVGDATYKARSKQINERPSFANPVLIRLANKSDIYAPLASLLSEFGLVVELRGIEQVELLALKESPFASEVIASDDWLQARVMVNAGRAYFFIRPQ